jgi:hypothetical protein
MNTKEVANKLVTYCRNGQFEEATKELYGNDIVSIEPEGAPARETIGLANVIAKGEDFNSMVEEFHGVEVSEPVVADNFFSISMKIDVTYKGAARTSLDEVCIYKVNDGKVVREEFFYTPPPQG